MVAPPEVRDVYGNPINLTDALARLRVLRGIVSEMERNPENWDRAYPECIGMYIYYNDEIEYLEGQIYNQVRHE